MLRLGCCFNERGQNLRVALLAPCPDSQPDLPEQIPVAQHVRYRLAKRRELARGNKRRTSALNPYDLPQHFIASNRRIVLGHAIPSNDEKYLIADNARTLYAVDEKPSFTHVQNDFAMDDFFRAAGLNRKEVAGPQRREHAQSPGS